MTLQQTIINDLLIIESDLGNQVLTWDGQDYVCSPSGLTDGATSLGMGGFTSTQAKSFTVRQQLFIDAVFPQQGDLVTCNNIELQIDSVSYDATSAFIVIHSVLPEP